MKSIIIIISIFTLSNASFLRELADATFQKADLSADCITFASGFKVTLTAASGTTVPTGITAKFTKGTDTFSSTDCAQDGQKDLVMDCGSFTIATTLSKGNYTLTLAHATDKNTITATPAPLCYTSECQPALAATQAKTASIAYEGDTAGNFTISFAAAFTTKPTINAGTVALTCTEATDKKSVVCTSTKTALEGGTKETPKTYTLTIGECSLPTGIVLSVTGAASFYKFSGLLLALLVLLF